MEILATIKRLSERYKVPIDLLADPGCDVELYVNYELVGHIPIDDRISDDYICSYIGKSVEKYCKGEES